MQVETARALIESIVYKPEWDMEVFDHTNRFESAITVKVTYPALETNRDMARIGYPIQNRPYATFPLMIADMDDTQLYRAIACIFLRIEEHEMREYFRIRSTYWAPFHPHHIDGIKRWNATQNVPAEIASLTYDLQFGIA